MRLRRAGASSIYTCCELIKCMRDKTAQDNAPKLEAAAKRHKQTIGTKTPQEKQHEDSPIAVKGVHVDTLWKYG